MAVVAACSASCSSSEITCTPARGARLDAARACLLAPTDVMGVNGCIHADERANTGVQTTCVSLDGVTGALVTTQTGSWLVGDFREIPALCAGYAEAPPCP